jgi:predicted metal-binding membrane protein
MNMEGSNVAGESRPLAAPTAADMWGVLILVVLAGTAWVVTVDRMQGMDMGPGTDLGAFGWFAGVWATMMAAMMLPSLWPMAVTYSRGAGGGVRPVAGTVLFAIGYLLVWLAAGLLAYALIEGVRSLDLGLLAWERAGQYVAGGVIAGAALYELTPVKARCLRHCRDSRLLRQRPGPVGALEMGVEQGGFCVGCSGALMAALFALGVMSIGWMILIAVLIALEKLLPWEVIPIGVTAALLVVLGVAVVFFPDEVPGLTIPMNEMSMPMDSMPMSGAVGR